VVIEASWNQRHGQSIERVVASSVPSNRRQSRADAGAHAAGLTWQVMARGLTGPVVGHRGGWLPAQRLGATAVGVGFEMVELMRNQFRLAAERPGAARGHLAASWWPAGGHLVAGWWPAGGLLVAG
jgi:hypothetical protein